LPHFSFVPTSPYFFCRKTWKTPKPIQFILSYPTPTVILNIHSIIESIFHSKNNNKIQTISVNFCSKIIHFKGHQKQKQFKFQPQLIEMNAENFRKFVQRYSAALAFINYYCIYRKILLSLRANGKLPIIIIIGNRHNPYSCRMHLNIHASPEWDHRPKSPFWLSNVNGNVILICVSLNGRLECFFVYVCVC
jgi:hypothetical protein